MDSVRLTLPRAELQRVLPTLLRRREGLTVWGPLYLRGARGGVELLVPQLHVHTAWNTPSARDSLLVRWREGEPALSDNSLPSPGSGSALLEITPDGAAGGLWRDTANHTWPLTSLFLPGAGMHQLTLIEPDLSARERATARWSRLAGALGEDTLRRLHRLHVAVVGVGRNGSLMTTSLARLGIRRLTLVDPDHIEAHNLDAMDGVSATDIGRPKVEALGNALRSGLDLRMVALPVTRRAAVRAVAEADLLVSCVDHDGARLAVGILAAAYLRPLLDVGTGVLGQGSERRLGADLRLILPGESRCLACYGGVTQRPEVEALLRPEANPPALWSTLRSGSLRSLNAVGVHLGLRLLEDLVDERITGSLWLRLDYEGAIPSIRQVVPRTAPDCPVCLRAGWGDAIETELPGLLATLAAGMNRDH